MRVFIAICWFILYVLSEQVLERVLSIGESWRPDTFKESMLHCAKVVNKWYYKK